MRHIFLYGPSGSGKSTLGALLAQDLDMPFLDLDKNIEAHTGIRIGNIMRGQGEEAFRDLESLALKDGVSPTRAGDRPGRWGTVARGKPRPGGSARAGGLPAAGLAQLVERLEQDDNQRRFWPVSWRVRSNPCWKNVKRITRPSRCVWTPICPRGRYCPR